MTFTTQFVLERFMGLPSLEGKVHGDDERLPVARKADNRYWLDIYMQFFSALDDGNKKLARNIIEQNDLESELVNSMMDFWLYGGESNDPMMDYWNRVQEPHR